MAEATAKAQPGHAGGGRKRFECDDQQGRIEQPALGFLAVGTLLLSACGSDQNVPQSEVNPAGVGIGFKPPRFMQPGDEMKITIGNLGTLTNRVK